MPDWFSLETAPFPLGRRVTPRRELSIVMCNEDIFFPFAPRVPFIIPVRGDDEAAGCRGR